MKKIVPGFLVTILLSACNYDTLPAAGIAAANADYGMISSITLYCMLAYALIVILRAKKVKN